MTIKVYKIRDSATGWFMTAGGGWNTRGKTWENMGHLKNAIAGLGYYSKSGYGGYNGANTSPLPPETWEVIEVLIVESKAGKMSVKDMVERERRLIGLSKKFGQPFSDLVNRIEKAGQIDQFKWVLSIPNAHRDETPINDMTALLKELKLKSNKDYKRVTTSGGGCFAFANKIDAMRVRLMFKHPCKGIDIEKFVETNVDFQEETALNSSTETEV